MKMSKGKKRFLIAGTALLMAGITAGVTLFHDSSEVSAVTKVFDGMTEYRDSQVRILEIVPTSEVWKDNGNIPKYQEFANQGMTDADFETNVHSELGYFMPASKTVNNGNGAGAPTSGDGNFSPPNITYVSRGGVHGQPYTSNTNPDNPAFTKHIYNLYLYGLVKQEGRDSGWENILGEYPIYCKSMFFSQFRQSQNCDTLLVENRLVDGYYTVNENGNGKYKIDDTQYRLNPDKDADTHKTNMIYSVTVSTKTVSGNTVETVSFNSVVDIDLSKLDLPTAKDGTKIITRAEDNDGNLDFHETMGVAVAQYTYKGYTESSFGQSVYYNRSDLARFRNSNWWDEYIMGDLYMYTGQHKANTPYDVIAAKDVTVDDIRNHDLIYISGKNEAFVNANSDISEAVLLELYNKEINENKAVMMDYAVYDENNVGTNNISRLAALLWQHQQSYVYTKYLEIDENTETKSHKWFDITKDENDVETRSLKASALTDPDLWTFLTENIISGATGNGNFITGNTYVYNHHMSDFVSTKTKVDALDIFANGDFNSAYTDTIVSQGLSAVSNYIDRLNARPQTTMFSTAITPAVCIQYILVADGVELANLKATLSVLEIEPVPAYLYNTGRGSEEYYVLVNSQNNGSYKAAAAVQNRQDFVTQYLADYYSDRIQFIKFTSMTLAEFNARSEDLVENYDIIYIGDETHRILSDKNGSPQLSNGNIQWQNLYYHDKNYLDTNHTTRNQQSWVWTEDNSGARYELKGYRDTYGTELPFFNDKSMIGNIYYCIGDYTRMYTSSNGITSPGWLKTEDPTQLTSTSDVIYVRYDSRDITKNKLEKLKEFLDSRALVLVAEDLLGTQQAIVNEDGTTTGNKVKRTEVNPTIVTGHGTDWENYDIYGRVDSSSNLYEFLQYGLGRTYNYTTRGYEATDTTPKGNLVAVSDIKQQLVDKEELGEYVSSYKLELNIINSPTEYSYEVNEAKGFITKDYYLKADPLTGKRTLEYEFTIVADAEIATGDFLVNLYVDVNKDGKFSKTQEKVQDVSVINAANGQEAQRNDDNTYKLFAGTRYILRRNIADSFNGLINWKLDIQSTSIGYLHDSKIGYTLVKPYGYSELNGVTEKKKEPINILQITTNAKNHLDMEGALYKYRIRGIDGGDDDLWGMYLANLQDYELYIRTIRVSQFEDLYTQYVRKNGSSDGFLEKFYVQYTGIDVDGKGTGTSDADFPAEFPRRHDTVKTEDATGTNAENVNADTMRDKDQRNHQGVDMIVCGFGDSISAFTNTGALGVIEDFMNAGHPVLTTHDFLIFRMSTHMQSRVLRDYFGEDKYGVSTNITSGNYPYSPAWNLSTTATAADRRTDGLDYLYTGTAYYHTNDLAKIQKIESGGKEVAYQPNSTRKNTVKETHGLSNFVIDRFRDYQGNNKEARYSWMNSPAIEQGATPGNSSNAGFKVYEVNKINEGQITSYPYYIPDSFKTTSTHGQWYTLDMTSDKDQDGESDVVIWYALGATDNTGGGENMFSDTIGGSVDPANGFYIYNDGNITYTGAGHDNLQRTDKKEEVQLFINTLLAAYSTGISAPSAGFYEQPYYDASPITSVVVPYDKNVTQVTDAQGRVLSDSSILKKSTASNADYKYKFVDPNADESVNASVDGTMVYYRIEDENFVRGTKGLLVNYYLVIKEEDVETVGDNKVYKKYPGLNNVPVVELTIDDRDYYAIDLTAVIDTYPVKGNYTLDNAHRYYRRENPTNENSKILSLRDIKPGFTYGIYLPMSLLKENAKFDIILKAQTEITSVSTGSGSNIQRTDPVYKMLSVVKADLLDLD